ncbi:hypothetical protein DL769_006507 [Monosporascus sp. CRB-8-3]|nr:hypothetical protein DL769_006507 [Monosporascus sp. CRB-8-3]
MESSSSPDSIKPVSEGSGDKILKTLQEFEKQHKLDPNIPLQELDTIEASLETGDAKKGSEVEAELVENNSPYPEVRAAVRNYDVDLPANTIRAWAIGLLLCTAGSAINMLFSLRNPSVMINTYVIQLIAYPVGLGWDLIFPDKEFNILGIKFNLKPGKFNFKEHVVIVVMTNAAYGGGVLYATDVLLAQQIFYKQHFGWAFQLLFGITTLCTGYGMAGLARRFLVWPAAMTNGWSIGRYRFFLYVMGLSYFTFVTWVAPNNVVVNKVFGGLHGYGILPTTLDWAVITSYTGSPLVPPFHAIANILAGVVVFFLIVSCGIHFSGLWYAAYFPVQSSKSFDNTGSTYNVSRILNDQMQFDEGKYFTYSPLFLSTQFALCYGLAFAAVSAVFVHVLLYHGADIKRQFRQARNQEDDIHMRLMKKYRETPDWWYLAVFVVMLAISFGVVCGWPTGFPAWAYVICIIIPLIWTIPVGIVQAITNVQIGLNVLTEFIIGYMLPGRPLAMMMFKNYGYISMSQALTFSQDLKLGHYMKVPPRLMFWSQLTASVWSAIVQIAVMNWALGTIPGVCSEDQPNGYICPGATVFYTASVIWGAIGPRRMFGNGALYAPLQWFWLVGVTAPVATWFLARRFPKSVFRYVSAPLIFGGSGMIPPATVYNYLCWGAVGWVFNWFIRRRYRGWWLQYNYITSAALDSGLIVSTIVIFFALYLSSATPPQWFGNVGVFGTLDQKGEAVKSFVEEDQTFGPATWP